MPLPEKLLQILIVEDNPVDATSTTRLLLTDPYHSYEVSAVETGKDGIDTCEQRMPDCILLDHNLPDMDGLEFLSHLIDAHGQNCVGVVMMTGQGNDEIAHEAMNLGANDYISKNVLTLGEVTRAIRSAIETTVIHRERKALEFMAYHDTLTGLGNRAMFNDRLNVTLADANSASAKFGVIVIGLGGFNQLVEALGRSAGDATLRVFGTRLASALDNSDTAVRLGSDEFAVITKAAEDGDRVVKVAERIVQEVETPLDYERRDLKMSVSIGAAIYPDNGDEADLLLRHADTAMYFAKRSGGGMVFYSAD